jgi:eukaryotic-like serine/threonine-protein kinase
MMAPPPRPLIGSVIANRYRVDSLLGEGGMAIVVGATDEETSARVAVKLLRLTGTGSAERFIREARVSWTLTSDHVPRFLDAGSAGGQLFIVMERLEGTDYGRRIREVGPLELTEVADCVVQACEALAHAHARGVVHRDIKASNLFLHTMAARDGSIVKVLDFGVSKILADSAEGSEFTLTTSRDGGVLGSPPYMSPEQVRDPRRVDARTDLWSLGVVAPRLLSAEMPFPGTTTGEVLASILERSAPRLSAIGVHVPSRVEHAVLRCLARSRDERFANVAELAAAFAPFVSPHWQHLPRQVAELLSVAPAHVVTPEVVTSTMTEAPSPPAAAPAPLPPPAAVPAVTVTTGAPTPSRAAPPRRMARVQMVALGAIGVIVLVLGIKAGTQRSNGDLTTGPTFSPLPPPMPELTDTAASVRGGTAVPPTSTLTPSPTNDSVSSPVADPASPSGSSTRLAPPDPRGATPAKPGAPKRPPKGPSPPGPKHPDPAASALHPNPYGNPVP